MSFGWSRSSLCSAEDMAPPYSPSLNTEYASADVCLSRQPLIVTTRACVLQRMFSTTGLFGPLGQLYFISPTVPEWQLSKTQTTRDPFWRLLQHETDLVVLDQAFSLVIRRNETLVPSVSLPPAVAASDVFSSADVVACASCDE